MLSNFILFVWRKYWYHLMHFGQHNVGNMRDQNETDTVAVCVCVCVIFREMDDKKAYINLNRPAGQGERRGMVNGRVSEMWKNERNY